MKILIIHNSYYGQGGEDEVAIAEKKMLEHYGHQVFLYNRSNKELEGYNFLKKIKFFLKDIFWSTQTYQELKSLIQREKPDIAHFHNVFFMVTLSAYDVCYEEKVPIVQTLHNYRLLCPTGLFYCDGHVCEDCVSYGIRACIRHKCWKNSYAKSALLARLVHQMRQKKIFEEKVSCFICPSRFCRDKYLKYGLPAEKLFVKPNFLYKHPGLCVEHQHYAVYVGALRDYKGVKTLIKAWQKIKSDFCLKIVGDGSLKRDLFNLSKGCHVEFLGQKSLQETIELIKRSSLLIAPAECYETFSRVIIEAYACGVPVIASRLGALAELVDDGKIGLLFGPGDVQDLSEKINFLLASPEKRNQMSQNAQKVFQEKYTMEKNYQMLMDVYRRVPLTTRETII